MGLVMLDTLTGGGGGGGAASGPRRKQVICYTSEAALALPEWFVAGRDIIRVTGCAPGGGGGGGSTSGSFNGGGGGAGASARDHVIPIPAGTTSLYVEMGMQGIGGDPGAWGQTGGDVILIANGISWAQGSNLLKLGGGAGGGPGTATNDGTGGDGGCVWMGNKGPIWSLIGADGGDLNSVFHNGSLLKAAWLARNFTVSEGSKGGKLYPNGGNAQLYGMGFMGSRTSISGGASPFGSGSNSTTYGAVGYGGGGCGGGINGPGSEGAPGFLLIVFEEMV